LCSLRHPVVQGQSLGPYQSLSSSLP
jgi:hypothetical protein